MQKINNKQGYYLYSDKPVFQRKCEKVNFVIYEVQKIKMPDNRVINTFFGYWHKGQTQGKLIDGVKEFEPKNSKFVSYYDKDLKNYKGEYDNLPNMFK
jgi:hypothetical protein